MQLVKASKVVGRHSLPTSQVWSDWFQGPELSKELLKHRPPFANGGSLSVLQRPDSVNINHQAWTSKTVVAGSRRSMIVETKRALTSGEELRWSFTGSQQRCCFNSGSSSGALAVSATECMTTVTQRDAKSDQNSSFDIFRQVTFRLDFCEPIQFN